jgi:hypothetical protein
VNLHAFLIPALSISRGAASPFSLFTLGTVVPCIDCICGQVDSRISLADEMKISASAENQFPIVRLTVMYFLSVVARLSYNGSVTTNFSLQALLRS